jgi:hypothetical protein
MKKWTYILDSNFSVTAEFMFSHIKWYLIHIFYDYNFWYDDVAKMCVHRKVFNFTNAFVMKLVSIVSSNKLDMQYISYY